MIMPFRTTPNHETNRNIIVKMDRKKFLFSTIGTVAGLSFPGLLRAFGHQAITEDVSVFNAGVSGNNTNNLLARLQTDCLSHNPTLTILMAGTNDMNNGKY